RLRIDGRVIDLEVAGVYDRGRRRRDSEAERIDDRVIDADRFDVERTGFHDVARHHGPQLDVVNPELSQFVADKTQRQGRAVNGKRNTLDEEGHGTDVILVAMREELRLHALRTAADVRHVRH